jgi:hypothetical protein
MCTERISKDQSVPMGEWAEGQTASWLSQGGEFNWYRIYGIRLRSQIQLSFPESESCRDSDVDLLRASPRFFQEATRDTDVKLSPTGWYKYAQMDTGQSYLRWDGLFEFLVDFDGRRVWCGWLGATSLESLQVYLLGHALSFAFVKQGLEPIHATSVVVDGHAIAFLGNSGFGKSSLAAAFLAAGHRLLTDDLLMLRQAQSGYTAQPGPPRIKLFPKMARRFLASAASGLPMNDETEKLVLPLSEHQCHDQSAPLRAIYVLAAPREVYRKQRIRVTPLSPRETFVELVRNTFNYLVTDSERLQRQHSESAQVAMRVPARRISHPRVLAMIPALSDAILADLAAVIVSNSEHSNAFREENHNQ